MTIVIIMMTIVSIMMTVVHIKINIVLYQDDYCMYPDDCIMMTTQHWQMFRSEELHAKILQLMEKLYLM